MPLGGELAELLFNTGLSAAAFAAATGVDEQLILEWTRTSRRLQQLPPSLRDAMKKELHVPEKSSDKSVQNRPLIETEDLDAVRNKLEAAGSKDRSNGIHIAFVVPAAGGMIVKDKALDESMRTALSVFSEDANFVDRLHSYFELMVQMQRHRNLERGDFELFVFVFGRWVVTVTPFGQGEQFTEALVTLSINRETFPMNIVSKGIRKLVDEIRSIR